MPVLDRPPVYCFGEWEIDLAQRELRMRGAAIPLGGRAFEIVEVLVKSAGQLVTKDDLMAAVWPGLVVEENTLQVHVAAVRKAFGANRGMLKTASGRGYLLAGGWRARNAETASVTPEPAEAAHGNLPARLSELIGRSSAVQELHDLLSTHRLVTVTGPGGIGKTTLAIEVARGLVPVFKAGGWLVELVSLTDPALVPSAVARALGLHLGGGEISAESVARAIGGRGLLLVIDNCEHLIDAVAQLVATLMRLCPHALLLATSREVLRVQGECVYHLLGLEVPQQHQQLSEQIAEHSAVQLFIAKLRGFGRTAPLSSETLQVIAETCRRLDGIPLAIEFAAARAAALGPELVLSRLDERFALLTGGPRTALAKQQTLRATLDWSYDLLPESERRLLRRLSIFAGTFTHEAATAVMIDTGADGPMVMEGIANLVAKSLVVLDAASRSRWRLLDTIRAYAAEKLRQTGEADLVAERHATFFRHLFPRDGPHDFTADELTLCRFEIDNVRASLDWAFSSRGHPQTGIALTVAYAPAWRALGLMFECRERTEQALSSLDGAPDLQERLALRLTLEHGTAVEFTMGPTGRSRDMLGKALHTAERLGDVESRLRAHWALFSMHLNCGECQACLREATHMARVAAEAGDAAAGLFAERLLGVAALLAGRLSEARRYFDRVLAQTSPSKSERRTLWDEYSPSIMARAYLARLLFAQGLIDQAMDCAQTSLQEARTLDYKLGQCEVFRVALCSIKVMASKLLAAERCIAAYRQVATATNSLDHENHASFFEGALMIRRREFTSGVALVRATLETRERIGWSTAFAEKLAALAAGLAGLGRVEEAIRTLERAIAWTERGGERWYVAELLRLKADLLLLRPNNEADADESYRQAIDLAREQGASLWELRAAMGLAGLQLRQGHRDAARKLLTPVYENITEGRDTADVRTAESLLESLR